jgi:hypothetical protein
VGVVCVDTYFIHVGFRQLPKMVAGPLVELSGTTIGRCAANELSMAKWTLAVNEIQLTFRQNCFEGGACEIEFELMRA